MKSINFLIALLALLAFCKAGGFIAKASGSDIVDPDESIDKGYYPEDEPIYEGDIITKRGDNKEDRINDVKTINPKRGGAVEKPFDDFYDDDDSTFLEGDMVIPRGNKADRIGAEATANTEKGEKTTLVEENGLLQNLTKGIETIEGGLNGPAGDKVKHLSKDISSKMYTSPCLKPENKDYCGANGNCDQFAHKLVCQCEWGFEGDRCDQVVECLNNCSGNGQCLRFMKKCWCNTGWKGKDCSKPMKNDK